MTPDKLREMAAHMLNLANMLESGDMKYLDGNFSLYFQHPQEEVLSCMDGSIRTIKLGGGYVEINSDLTFVLKEKENEDS